MLQFPSFFMNINKAWHEKRLTAGLKLFVQEFSRIKDTLEALRFIYGNGSPWWLCTLSFASEEFQIRDGLTLPPPPFRDSFEFVFEKFLGIDLKSWKIIRSECPQQNDSNNCGIIALGAMEQLCSRGIVEIWSQKIHPNSGWCGYAEWWKNIFMRPKCSQKLNGYPCMSDPRFGAILIGLMIGSWNGCFIIWHYLAQHILQTFKSDHFWFLRTKTR